MKLERHRIEEIAGRFLRGIPFEGEDFPEGGFPVFVDVLIGASLPFQKFLVHAALAARNDDPVLITGATGVGKCLATKAIHQRSNRRQGAFVAVNCAAIPGHLAESELFGHERGAFTDADRQKKGQFELADGGTLYLDEISSMPLELQAKLLRGIDEREIRRVGGEEALYVWPRVIASAKPDILDMVLKGQFREDLFYRLERNWVYVPSLIERCEDIPLLMEHFRSKYDSFHRFSEAATEALMKHSWPGNIRELENVIGRAVRLADLLDIQQIPRKHLNLGLRSMSDTATLIRVLAEKMYDDEIELDTIDRGLLHVVLELCKGNKTHAGKVLGITPRTIRNILRREAEQRQEQE